MRKVLFGFVFVCTLFATSIVSAQTLAPGGAGQAATSTDALLQQIQQLLALVQSLQQQLVQLQGGNTITSKQQTQHTITIPNIPFGINQKGSHVTELQKFLISTGDLTEEATGYYGTLTTKAVQKYQCREMNICNGNPSTNGYGLAGPGTRAHMRARASAQSAVNNTPTTIATPKTLTPTIVPSGGGGSGTAMVTNPPATVSTGGGGGGATTVSPVLTYSWQTGGWSTCINSTQSRTVSCTSSNNTTVADSLCTSSKPTITQSCTITTTPQNQSCTFSNQTVAHGASVSAYQTASVAYGQTCAQQTRTCTNGTLSGSYTFASCAPAQATCTPLLQETRTQSCPAGQTGSITQMRTSSCAPGTLTPAWGDWTVVSNSCLADNRTEFLVTEFGALLTDTLPDDAAFNQCVSAAKHKSGTCTIPIGTLTLSTYPSSLRNGDYPAQSIINLNGLTLKGQGSGSIIKGVSQDGFDVLQLNAISHLTIQDLSITASKTGASLDHGVNGISITSGSNNISIKNVHVRDLPHVLKSEYIDGGKAFTVQSGTQMTASSLQNIKIENSSSRNVAYGFELSVDTNLNVEPDNIELYNNDFEGSLVGVSFSFVQSQPLTRFAAAIIGNRIAGGQNGIILGRGRGYYIKSNNIQVNSSLLNQAFTGLYPQSAALWYYDVQSVTSELNDITMPSGDSFFKTTNPTMDIIFRYNKFFGNPTKQILITPTDTKYIKYFQDSNYFNL